MQEIARELDLLRRHNLGFKEGDPQAALLLIAEAAVVCLALERFLRILLGGEATERHTLQNLLEMAVSDKRNLVKLPWPSQQDGVKRVVSVRNTLLHGNYEQAARENGCADIRTYFKTKFASETEGMYKVLDHLMTQIDPATGRPHALLGGG